MTECGSIRFHPAHPSTLDTIAKRAEFYTAVIVTGRVISRFFLLEKTCYENGTAIQVSAILAFLQSDGHTLVTSLCPDTVKRVREATALSFLSTQPKPCACPAFLLCLTTKLSEWVRSQTTENRATATQQGSEVSVAEKVCRCQKGMEKGEEALGQDAGLCAPRNGAGDCVIRFDSRSKRATS